MMGRLQFAVGLAVCAASLAGCAHETAADRAPRSGPVARLAPVGDPPWRETFGAPALAELLNRADAGAFDIKLALARLDRAQADIDIARAATRPQVSVGLAGASGGRQLDSHRERAAPTLEVAYDFDLGGRISRLRAAAAAEHDASADDVTSARLLVAAATSRLYVTYCVAQDAIAAAARRNDEASRMMSLVRARRAEGVATQDEEHLGQAALDAASERDRAAHLEATSALNGLASLIGADHVAVECPGGIPVPSAAPTSLNADLVDQRPETRAAFARVKAADFRRAAAVAAERPRFEISAVIGAPDAAIVTLLGTRALAWALAARAGEGLLDGGAARGRIRSASAEADIAELEYRKTVLAGWSALRSAAVADVSAGQTLAAAQAAVARAEAGLRATQARHDDGISDGLALATARQGLEDARDGLRGARALALEARINRILAGGGR